MKIGAAVLALTVTVGSAAAVAGAGAPAPRTLTQKCGDTSGISAKPFWLETADAVRLYAIEVGTGSVGVVLAHESPADLCGWLPYIATLTHAGLRVLSFDFRGFGDSQRPGSTRKYLAYGADLGAAVRACGARACIGSS